MPGLSGLALTTEKIIEILSLYSSASQPIVAVATAPGWHVVGAFPMPTTADIRLDLIGSVSNPALIMTARMFCVTPGSEGPVSGSSVQLSSTTSVQVFSGQFELVGNRLYEVHVQVVGFAGDSYFGSARRAAPAGI
jgi:predicted ABC-type sugar transport system permease subunit